LVFPENSPRNLPTFYNYCNKQSIFVPPLQPAHLHSQDLLDGHCWLGSLRCVGSTERSMFARVSCACRHGSWVVLCNLCQDDGLCYGGFEKDLGRVSQVMRNRDFWGVRVHIYPVYREGLVRYIARSINRHISSTSYIKSCMHQLKYLRNLHHHHRIHCQGACALCGLSTACFGGLVRDILCVGLSIKQFKFTAVLDILQP